jgi:hypothetical protein
VCTSCRAKSILKHTAASTRKEGVNSGTNDAYNADDEGASSLPASPREVDNFTTSNFTSRHVDLLAQLDALTISSSETEVVATDLLMTEACECASSTETPCGNTRKTTLIKNGLVTKEARFSIVFGHVKDEGGNTEKIYEICIMDTRHQRMCHLGDNGCIKSSLVGQYEYNNAINTCQLQVPIAVATLVDASTATASSGAGSVVMATYTRPEAPPSKGLVPPPNLSCFVCCTLLDEDADSIMTDTNLQGSNYNRRRHVYLKSHKNWAHSNCTVKCESNRLGVCMGACPRLNTFVSTQFDETARFENVCVACLAPTFKEALAKPATTKSRVGNGGKTSRENGGSSKRKVEENWLTDAASLRKKAALNIVKKNMTAQQRASADAYVFPTDLSGVYNDKIRGTWYTLDMDGKNPSPVCGLPFFDTYFNTERTWNTLGEREQAITSHQCLTQMFEM